TPRPRGAPIPRRAAVSKRRVTVLRGGMATAGLVAAMAGVHALRRAGAKVLVPVARDLYRGEDFSLIDSDRAGEVRADDGVVLATRECGPADAPVTVVFVHGFCNTMESFHFQRRHLEQRWGPQVRMVLDRKSTRLNSSHVKISYA